MKNFAIMYDFKNGDMKGNDVYELTAENKTEAIKKLYRILSGYKSLQIRKCEEYSA